MDKIKYFKVYSDNVLILITLSFDEVRIENTL